MTATNPCPEPRRSSRWSRQQIRAARMAPLAPLLQKRGLQLRELPAGNFELPAFRACCSKTAIGADPAATWLGNAIDFFVQVLGLSFNDAMRQITQTQSSGT